MKGRDTAVVERTGTMSEIGEVTQVSLDEASIQYIIKFLTDLYSDKVLAPIREYSTNALDSHRAAGNDGPIHVFLPTPLRPTFIVQDFGLGMTVEQIQTEFSKYGFSSKRDTNEAVGYLGLGCKSGLTYTSQLSIISIKNGVKATVIMSRGTNEVGQLQIVDTVGTDEPNGVTIEIPVSDADSFSAKALGFYRFWDPGTVLVDGRPPESIWEQGPPDVLALDPDILIVDGLFSDYVVMGNVPYPVRIGAAGMTHSHVVARVEIGAVDFVPSREALEMTDVTTEVVGEIRKFVDDRLFLHVQADIDSAPNHWEALKTAKQWGARVSFGHNNRKITYQGEKIPSSLPIQGWKWSVPYQVKSSYSKASKISYISLDGLLNNNDILLVFGHRRGSVEHDTKAAIVELDDKPDEAYVISRMSPAARRWVSGARMVRFEELRPKQPKVVKERGQRGPVEKWLVRKDGTKFFTAQEIPESRPVVYFLKQENTMGSGRWGWTKDKWRESLIGFIDGQLHLPVSLVMVSKSHLDRFLKAHPEAMTIEQFFQKTLDETDRKITDDMMLWNAKGHALNLVDADRIKDSSARRVIRRLQACHTEEARLLIQRRNALLVAAKQYVNVARVPDSHRKGNRSDLSDKVREWEKKYPLANVDHLRDDHIEYCNAVFAYRKRSHR